MKLIRYGKKGKESPGILLDNGTILDVRASAFHIEDYNEHFFSHFGLKQLQLLRDDPSAKIIPGKNVRLGPPLAHPSKIICVGENYADHAAEFGHLPPAEPILFSKANSALNGPTDPIILPQGSQIVDSEVELAIIIGKNASNVSEKDALDYVAGYTILNDVSERVTQKNNGQWFRGKSFDTFCPLGPYIVTPDELSDINNITLWQKLNGQIVQEDNTKNMLFPIPFLIAHISSSMTLLPGDIISTGTPSGIGSAHTPPILMKNGDTIEMGINNMGSMKSPVKNYPA